MRTSLAGGLFPTPATSFVVSGHPMRSELFRARSLSNFGAC